MPEFDRHAAGYEEEHRRSVACFGEETSYFAAYKAADVRRLCGDLAGQTRILDFGSGIGGLIPHLASEFPSARITAVDVSRESILVARSRYGHYADCQATDGDRIPFTDGSFNLAIVSCVMHHMTGQQHGNALREIRRVLAPHGLLFVFEHNPWNPLTRYVVSNCEFDENARLIALPTMLTTIRGSGFNARKWEFRLFFPAALAAFRPAERWLTWCPLGAQYLVAAER